MLVPHKKHQVHARHPRDIAIPAPNPRERHHCRIKDLANKDGGLIQKIEKLVSVDWISIVKGNGNIGENGITRGQRGNGENGDLDQSFPFAPFPRCPRVDPLPPQPPLTHAHRKPCFESGSDRTRVPEAAKIALATAGSTGGSDGSPRPVGGLFDFSQCTSITGGA